VSSRFAVIALLLGTMGCQQRASSPLLTPSADALAKPAPDSFDVAFQTGKGRFVVRAIRAWAPQGADRFYFLATNGYYDGAKFFRVLPDFIVQFGIHGDPAINEVWRDRRIPDDPVRQSNQAGFVTYAMGGPNSRTVQLFINKRDNRRLDSMGFAPIGRVIDGMHVIEQLHGGYGEGAPRGAGPSQDRIQQEGNAYLERWFPKLDSIARAQIVKD
jgi:peptidyl-prolyl cis-trans isomerase A (cyclophilin A)